MLTIALFCLFLLLPAILLIVARRLRPTRRVPGGNVCVLVLGDIGRSPRMRYHAISFTKRGYMVDVVGYPSAPPTREFGENPRIRLHYLRPPPELQNQLPRLLCYVVKVLWQTVDLLWLLFRKRTSGWLLMQNPPAIPTIPVCWFYCALMDVQFTIDWHNYAHSLMALSLGKDHVLVRLARIIETTFGRRAKNNFCVTKAMKEDLEKRWAIKATVLYDRPADEFHPISLAEKHEFLLKLAEKYNVFSGARKDSTVLTECSSNGVHLSLRRPGLIVSSTSWTEDEDFSILLNALQEYEDAYEDGESSLPDLICVITGKGPLKDFYIAIVNLKSWKHVQIITPWLENEDYPKMLASADLGVCLHTSSSGLDLPMKVVDMFGCGLPVCAYDFNWYIEYNTACVWSAENTSGTSVKKLIARCKTFAGLVFSALHVTFVTEVHHPKMCILSISLSELVRHNENSLVFADENELAQQLKMWFRGFPNNDTQRQLDEKFRQNLQAFQENRWHGNWSLNVLPCFRE